MEKTIITLTTDFGLKDPYVGTMKGMILGIASCAVIVDITHGITPHSVLEASFVLKGSYSYFPGGTLHVAVVDPGVGGPRRVLYLEKGGHRFLAPDNGLLTGILEDARLLVSVEKENVLPRSPSATFHGRDVFAPIAARLATGLDPLELGPAVTDPVRLDWPEPDVDKGVVEGCVLYIDVFGNLVTNIEGRHLSRLPAGARVFLKGDEIGPPQKSYQESEKGRPLALVNSFGLLEIAVREENAARRFNAGTGDEVIVAGI